MFPYADDTTTHRKLAWMNWLLIFANILVFHFTYKNIILPKSTFLADNGFVPRSFVLGLEHNDGTAFVPIFTAMFLHKDVIHLLGNMWLLHLFGDAVEVSMGPVKYLL